MAKTTLELSREEWRRYNPSIGLEGRLTEAHAGIELRKAEAWRVALEAAHLLKKNYGARKVLVCGSLANDVGFNHWSDIDLAVAGVAPDLFYSAVAAVTGLSSTFQVDLIDLEDCRPGIKKVIEQEGCEL